MIFGLATSTGLADTEEHQPSMHLPSKNINLTTEPPSYGMVILAQWTFWMMNWREQDDQE